MTYNDISQPMAGEDPPYGRIRAISPVEVDIAFALSAHRDLADLTKMDEWKKQFLTVSYEYLIQDVQIEEWLGLDN